MEEEKQWRMILTVLFFAVEAMVLSLLIEQGNSGYISNAAAGLALWAVFIIFEYKYQFLLNNFIRASVMLTLISDSLFGQYLNGYVTSPLYDRLQHAFGTYSFALLGICVVWMVADKPFLSRRLISLSAFFIGIGLGGLYEVVEFVQDTWFRPEVLNQPSLYDTDLDLISDLIGALIAYLHLNYSHLSNRMFHSLKSPSK